MEKLLASLAVLAAFAFAGPLYAQQPYAAGPGPSPYNGTVNLSTQATGTLQTAQAPAITGGDCTASAGSVVFVCTKSNGTAFGSLAFLSSVPISTGVSGLGAGVSASLAQGADSIGGFLTPPIVVCSSGQYLTFLTNSIAPTCATPAGSGGGNVSNSGTPTSGQVALWVNATTLQGIALNTAGNILAAPSAVCPTGQFLSWPTLGSPMTCATPAGGGNVSNSGTPTSGQVALWVNATTIQGIALNTAGNILAAPSAVCPTGQFLSWSTLGSPMTCSTPAGGGSGSAPYVNAVTTCSVDNTGATDVTTTLNNCLSTYGSVALSAGTYLVSNCVNVNINGNLTGTGPVPAKGTTTYTGIVVTTVGGVTITSNSTTNSVVCLPNGFSGKVGNFFVTKSVIATSGCGLDYAIGGTTASVAEDVWIEKQYYGVCANSSAYSVLSRILVQNSLSHGIYFRSTATASGVIYQWMLKDVISQFNEGNGVYMNCPTGATNCITGTPWYNVQTYSNTGGGIWFIANGTATLQDLELVSCVGSSDGNDELRVVGTISGSSGGYAKITGGLYELAGQTATGNFNGSASHDAASNIGYGINILYMTNPIITNASIDDNSYDGILINVNSSNPTYGSIANNYINNNSRSAAGTFAGINIYGSQTAIMSILGNSSLTTPGFSYQKYGSTITNTNASSVIMQTGNSETGTSGGCFTSGFPTYKPIGTGQLYNSGTLCP